MELVAISAAQSAMGVLLRKLGDLVAKRYTLLGGVRDEIQELKDELESMTACFRDVAGIGDDDMKKEQVRDNTEASLKLSCPFGVFKPYI